MYQLAHHCSLLNVIGRYLRTLEGSRWLARLVKGGCRDETPRSNNLGPPAPPIRAVYHERPAVSTARRFGSTRAGPEPSRKGSRARGYRRSDAAALFVSISPIRGSNLWSTLHPAQYVVEQVLAARRLYPLVRVTHRFPPQSVVVERQVLLSLFRGSPDSFRFPDSFFQSVPGVAQRPPQRVVRVERRRVVPRVVVVRAPRASLRTFWNLLEPSRRRRRGAAPTPDRTPDRTDAATPPSRLPGRSPVSSRAARAYRTRQSASRAAGSSPRVTGTASPPRASGLRVGTCTHNTTSVQSPIVLREL